MCLFRFSIFVFSANFYCGQTERCIKMPLGMEIGLSLGDFVLDGDPTRPLNFRPIYYSTVIVIKLTVILCSVHIIGLHAA